MNYKETALDTKKTAVTRYIDERLDIEPAVVGGVRRNPGVLNRDSDLRNAGLQSSLTLYKLSMYELGVTPSDISRGVVGLKEQAEKGARGTSKAFETAAGASLDILMRTGNERNGNQNYPESSKILKPGKEELLRARPR